MIQIIYTSDVHSNIFKIAGELKNIKEKCPNSLVIDNGDFIEGSCFYCFSKGKTEINLLSTYYDVINVGNHGFRHYLSLKDKLPIICANIYKNNTNVFKESISIQKNGISYIFIGFISKEAFEAIPEEEREGLEWRDRFEWLKKMSLKIDKNVHIFLLSHSGFENDCCMAKELSNIDIIFSGHCHSNNKPTFLNHILIFKIPDLGDGYGEILLKDKQIKMSIKNLKIQRNNDYAIKKSLISFDKWKNVEVGILLSELKTLNTREHLLKHLLPKIQHLYKTDISIFNIPIIRELPKNNIFTKYDLYQLSPFNNKIYTFEIAKELFFKIVDSYENKNLLVSESKNTLSKNIKVATSSYLYNNLFKKYSYNLQSHQFFTTFLKKHILQKS